MEYEKFRERIISKLSNYKIGEPEIQLNGLLKSYFQEIRGNEISEERALRLADIYVEIYSGALIVGNNQRFDREYRAKIKSL